MKVKRLLIVLVAFALLAPLTAFSQTNLYFPRDWQKALGKNTRSQDGRPGPNYWQNSADYNINVAIDPNKHQVSGTETIVYANHSPDTLRYLVMKFIENAHLPLAFRATEVDSLYITSGVSVSAFKINNTPIPWDNAAVNDEGDPTNPLVPLSAPLSPGGQIRLDISWSFDMPRSEDHREGVVDSTAFYCAYWYPRVSVYDDVHGWDRIPFNEQIEFYNDFNNYDISIRVPRNYVIWATGELQNPKEVLSENAARLLEQSLLSDQKVVIAAKEDMINGKVTANANELIWHFKADNITDFAFGGSNHFIWEAASVVADSVSGRRVSVQTAYKPTSEDYPSVLDVACKSVSYFSHNMPGVPFPFPKITIFNGYGQMEYPMMCNDVEQGSMDDTYTLTTHEIAHTYFPFYMGINESRYAWMDEGWATFFEYHACTEALTLENKSATYPDYYMRKYLSNPSTESEVPLMTPSEQLLPASYGLNSYGKPAAAYTALKIMLGTDLFKKCLHTYMDRWHGKHPTPSDFFLTFNDVSGQDLNWFWKRWFMEFNTLDVGIEKLSQKNGNTWEVVLQNKGGKPVPVQIKITFADGKSKELEYNPYIWRNSDEVTLSLNTTQKITRIELLHPLIPDVNQVNDFIEVK